MNSILTVTAAATNRLLITVEQVKTELAIADSNSDAQIETLRRRASQAIVSYCNREFARDAVSEVFRDVAAECLNLSAGFPDPVHIAGYCEIASVTEDGRVLTSDQYEIDAGAGLLYRLYFDHRCSWYARKVTVEYATGYILPDDSNSNLPEDVQGAALELIKAARFNAARDPALRSENILSGLYSYTLFDPTNADDQWPTAVTSPMVKYFNPKQF